MFVCVSMGVRLSVQYICLSVYGCYGSVCVCDMPPWRLMYLWCCDAFMLVSKAK